MSEKEIIGMVDVTVLESSSIPVIDASHPELAGNQYGFEGGSVVVVGNIYYLFTAEMAGDPFWAKMRLACWQSPDLSQWSRVGTLYETSGAMDLEDHRFSLWAPMPIYDEESMFWNLFYVAYRPGSTSPLEVSHHDGQIWRAVSQVKGREGITGPYQDVDIILQPDARSQTWEGQQGTDSFYPWKVGDKWYAFYGSHNYNPHGPWVVGMAESHSLAGPWQRCLTGNPSPIEPFFIENPIVTHTSDRWVVVYDSSPVGEDLEYMIDRQGIGIAVSQDGINWNRGNILNIQSDDESNWTEDIRTPLGLIHEKENLYSLLFTVKEKNRLFWSVGRVRLRLGH